MDSYPARGHPLGDIEIEEAESVALAMMETSLKVAHPPQRILFELVFEENGLLLSQAQGEASPSHFAGTLGGHTPSIALPYSFMVPAGCRASRCEGRCCGYLPCVVMLYDEPRAW